MRLIKKPIVISYEEQKKKFCTLFNSMVFKHNHWTLFYDFVELFAIALENAVNFSQKREDRYLEIVKGYTKEELDKLIEMSVCVTLGLEAKYSDFLGEVFQDLQLNDKKGKGQCFTPFSVSRAMADMTFTKEMVDKAIKEKGILTINDPCVGGGSLPIAAMNTLKNLGYNYQRDVLVVANDLDKRCVLMSYIQLSLLGVPAVIMEGDTLKQEFYETHYTPFFYLNQKAQSVFKSLGKK